MNPCIRKSGARWLRTSDVLGIRKAERDVFLEGDMEAYAKVDIEVAEILGQYAGVEMTEEEWRFLFEGTKEEIQNQKCLGGGTVRLPSSLCKQGDDEMEIKEPPRKKRKRGRPRKVKNEKSGSAGNTKHECDRCHKCFPSSSALGGHRSKSKCMRDDYIPTTEKLQCTHCEKQFTRGGDLYSHLRDKHHVAPFSCGVRGCSAKFEYSRQLQEHCRTVHATTVSRSKSKSKFKKDVSNRKSKASSCPDDFEVMKLYIDPVLAQSNSPLLMINDCRANIYEEQLTEEDERRQNCEMISVKVNGWPTTLIRSTRKIEKDEPLYLFYGLQYAKVLEAVDQIKLRKDKNERVVDAELAKMNHP